MLLHIQDPNYSKSYSLHEALIEACSSASCGNGAYAFVSKTGVDLLLGDIEFEKMLVRGPYQLIVGTDQITNTATIKRLSELQEKNQNLGVKAFLHNTKNSLFHPKVSYFKEENGCGKLVIGSGNLTTSGLRKNREAFSVVNLSKRELKNVDALWKNWLDESSDFIRPITDDEVLAKVAENIIRARVRQDTPKPAQPILTDETSDSEQDNDENQEWNFQDKNLVLLAEIPRSGNRWNQANFDMGTFRDFFGATPGCNSHRILLRNVLPGKTLGHIESRPSVSVISQNYRFELEAAAGLAYPKKGRPIGIFARISTRMFIYKLLMPSDPKHAQFSEWMNMNWSGRSDRLKRIVREAGSIKELLKNSLMDNFLV